MLRTGFNLQVSTEGQLSVIRGSIEDESLRWIKQKAVKNKEIIRSCYIPLVHKHPPGRKPVDPTLSGLDETPGPPL